ncbi:hypothetical protein B9Q11_02385 [Candidatus Marsarchaeota G2 archaeon ECH_B_SAG-F08]|uniref:Uncharacterized protein n=2 Tax=Candidatus Marsarchaeota TaxID=1978152 RepID=A0A2R6A9Y7_9ARCH|nr:MAG: hypothetical protein B9Q02_10800 [Candidatus Marsarchaeota G1 archaeon BE_D]PSN98358.1 MAG: hypothetical protein B9Q11_02385 [Candidatus Marsarchaeota G2 archaeon ECH_B_SAG-F08]
MTVDFIALKAFTGSVVRQNREDGFTALLKHSRMLPGSKNEESYNQTLLFRFTLHHQRSLMAGTRSLLTSDLTIHK